MSISHCYFAVAPRLAAILIVLVCGFGARQAECINSRTPSETGGCPEKYELPKLSKYSVTGEPSEEEAGTTCHMISGQAQSLDGNMATAAAVKLMALEFEVFGKVQGVFFRKYTVNKGKELGLRGWCQNTYQGTVVGEIEGPQSKVVEMKEWLSKVGSPQSKISKADFRSERSIDKYTFNSFDVRR